MNTDQPTTINPTRRWYQYSLRTLLIFVTLFAVACSWFTVKRNQAGKQREAVESLRKLGCGILYDVELLPSEKFKMHESPAPRWLQNLIGKDFFCTVTYVIDENGKLSDATMVYLKGLPDLQSLTIHDAHITDEGLENLKELTQLRSIHIWFSNSPNLPVEQITIITDAGLINLKQMHNLMVLNIMGARIRGDGLEILRGMKQLETINLDGNPITDEGMTHIKAVKQLQVLGLMNAQITDVGLDCLKELTQLKGLKISKCPGISDAGVQDLQKALPKLKKIIR